ncbi:unnamed protein product [Chironomus riparius]|uniref:Uncharacterized protein n=1 Tax=Chironomus riparius TaxID=315576 RepID=A0A9N9S454_9DIPT|nr:unnamed protein product [Chironomus riparius]
MDTSEIRDVEALTNRLEVKDRSLTDTVVLVGCGAFVAITVTLVILNGAINNNFIGKEDPFDNIMLWNFDFIGPTKLIAFLTLLIFILNLAILSYFAHFPKFMIWTLSIGCVVALVGFGSSVAKIKIYFGFIAVFLAIAAVVLIISLQYEIPVVAAVFKESTMFIRDIWFICLLPVLTLFVASIATRFFYQLCKILTNPDSTVYFAEISLIFTIYSYIFVIIFIFECQNFLVVGVTSKAYFDEDRCSMWQQMITIFWNLNIRDETVKNLKNSGLEYQVRSSYIYVIKNGTSLAVSAKTISTVLVSTNADKLVPLKLYIIFVHAVWKFFLFLSFTWAFMFIAVEHPKLLTITETKSSIKYAILLYIIGIVHGCVSSYEMVVDTLIVCMTIDYNEDKSDRKIGKMKNLIKIINSNFEK